MLAHERASRGERIVLADHLDGARAVALLYERNVRRHVHVSRAQGHARDCLLGFLSADAALNMAGIFSFKGVEALEDQITCVVSNCAVCRIAQKTRALADVRNNAFICLIRQHRFHVREDSRNALTAWGAFTTRLSCAGLQQGLLHCNRARARGHALDATGVRLQKLADALVVIDVGANC